MTGKIRDLTSIMLDSGIDSCVTKVYRFDIGYCDKNKMAYAHYACDKMSCSYPHDKTRPSKKIL